MIKSEIWPFATINHVVRDKGVAVTAKIMV